MSEQSNPTARIRPSKDGKGLWLFIDAPGHSKIGVEDLETFNNIKDSLDVRDSVGEVAWPILPEEVEAIRNACNDWLEWES